MDWNGLSYSTLTAQSEFEVRFFDRGPIAYSQVIQLFAGKRWSQKIGQHYKWISGLI